MRFSKSSVKTHIVRGATSKQAKSRSVQKAGPSCEKNSFYWCKTTQTISYDFIKILVQKISKMGTKERSQPLQSKEIKISSTVLIHKIYQRAIKPPKDFYQIFKPSTFVQWARCPPGTQPGQQTQGFNLYIFLQQREFNVFWVEIGK